MIANYHGQVTWIEGAHIGHMQLDSDKANPTEFVCALLKYVPATARLLSFTVIDNYALRKQP